MLSVKEDTEVFLMKEAKKVVTKQQVGDYRVYIVTWNVGSRFPDNITLRNLLDLELNEQGELLRTELPHIYAIGMQEVNVEVKQQMRNMFCDDQWTEKAMELLHDLDYVTVQTEQMQGLLLSIFIKRELVPHLRDIEAEYTRTGFGGIWGNKGAISIRFNLLGCGLVFVEAHLAAHDRHLEERVADYKQILEKHHYHVSRYREIYDHDYVWWFGDLNFRLHGKDTAEEVRDAVLNGEMSKLLERDQLNYMRLEKKEIFELLNEETPTFPPTFKFKEGTSEYDTKRRPAWTDRILYAMQPICRQPNMPLAIKQLSYRSHGSYKISDHKPVSAEFNIKLLNNQREPGVTFAPIDVWLIGQENTVHYTKDADFVELGHDWVGLFPVQHNTLRDYLAYEYVDKNDCSSSSASSEDEQLLSAEERPNYSQHRRPKKPHAHHLHHVRRERVAELEEVHLGFPEDIDYLEDGDMCVLIYFQTATGKRGVTSIAGISNEFKAIENVPES